ncbi:MAG: hypothetical protein ABW153_14060, partial [Sedimenticola sp.]
MVFTAPAPGETEISTEAKKKAIQSSGFMVQHGRSSEPIVDQNRARRKPVPCIWHLPKATLASPHQTARVSRKSGNKVSIRV